MQVINPAGCTFYSSKGECLMEWLCPKCYHYNDCPDEIFKDAINDKEWEVPDECVSCGYLHYLEVDLYDEE